MNWNGCQHRRMYATHHRRMHGLQYICLCDVIEVFVCHSITSTVSSMTSQKSMTHKLKLKFKPRNIPCHGFQCSLVGRVVPHWPRIRTAGNWPLRNTHTVQVLLGGLWQARLHQVVSSGYNWQQTDNWHLTKKNTKFLIPKDTVLQANHCHLHDLPPVSTTSFHPSIGLEASKKW